MKMNNDKVNFKTGDVVILKSGGPPMTIVKVMLLCEWQTGDKPKIVNQASFNELTVKKIPNKL